MTTPFSWENTQPVDTTVAQQRPKESQEFSWENTKPVDKIPSVESKVSSLKKGLIKGVIGAGELIGTTFLNEDKLGTEFGQFPEINTPEFQKFKEEKAFRASTPEEQKAVAEELNKKYPSNEGLIERTTERTGKLLPMLPFGVKRTVAAIAGGQTAEELGAGDTGQAIAELLSFTSPELYKGLKYLATKGKDFLTKAPEIEKARKALITAPGAGEPPPPGSGGATPYETAESALQELQSGEIAKRPPPEPPPPPSPVAFQTIQTSKGAQAPSLSGRITPQQSKQLGLTIPVVPKAPTPEQSALGIFKHRIYNTTKAGLATTKNIRQLDMAAYENVGKLYEKSRELNAGISDARPELVDMLQGRINNITRIPSPSSIENKLLGEARTIQKRLAIFDKEGNITGYRPISNQDLIDQVQSIRKLIDYDFAHGDASGIFKPLISDIESSILHSAESQGGKEAVESLQKARGEYKKWADTYNNDYIRPFRDETNKDFSKNFNKLQDLDNFNVAKPLLEQTEEGTVILEGLQREIVEKNLGKFLKKPLDANPEEFNKALRELEAVLSPEQVSAIKTSFDQGRQRLQRRVKQGPVTSKTPSTKERKDKVIEQYTGKTVESLQEAMHTRTGVKQIRQDLGQTETGKKFFKEMSRDTINRILNEGNVDAKSSAKKLYDVLNKEKNREVLIELTSKETVDEIFRVLTELGDRKVTPELMKKLIRKGVIIAELGEIGLLL